MILARLANSEPYVALHPGFEPALAWLQQTNVAALAAGKHPLEGDRLFILIGRDTGQGQDGAQLEAHRKYIDIQYVAEGVEVMGWRPVADCTPVAPFDSAKDIVFFTERPETWLCLPAGTLAIFYPADGHAPLGGAGPVVKAVIKVAIDWGAYAKSDEVGYRF